jgi:hypothetical protein
LIELAEGLRGFPQRELCLWRVWSDLRRVPEVVQRFSEGALLRRLPSRFESGAGLAGNATAGDQDEEAKGAEPLRPGPHTPH